MNKPLLAVVLALLCTPFAALAQGVLNVYQTVEINAPAAKVWNGMSWDGLHAWHPVFASTELLSGKNNTVGAVRRVAIKDGPAFDEELLDYDSRSMRLRYRIIGENALPLTGYESSLRVTALGPNQSFVAWRGSFVCKPGAKDAEVMAEINGLYRMGLDNLKQLIESR